MANEPDFQAMWRDQCALLDEIEQAIRMGEQQKAMTLVTSRFALMEKYGLTIVPLGPVPRRPQ